MTRDIDMVRFSTLNYSNNNQPHIKVSDEYPSSKSNYISHLYNTLVVRLLANIFFFFCYKLCFYCFKQMRIKLDSILIPIKYIACIQQ